MSQLIGANMLYVKFQDSTMLVLFSDVGWIFERITAKQVFVHSCLSLAITSHLEASNSTNIQMHKKQMYKYTIIKIHK